MIVPAVKAGDEIEGLGKVVEITNSRGAYITFLTDKRGKVRYTKRQPVTLVRRET